MSENAEKRVRCGRPSKATPERLASLAAELRRWEIHGNKATVAQAAKISLATLMRWQKQHRELREIWERGCQLRCQRRAETCRQRADLYPRLPTRQMRLICWFLVHRVCIRASVTPEHERNACKRVNLSLSGWEDARLRFPQLLDSVRARRARRYAFLLEHGSVPVGWTPPDPNNLRTAATTRGSYQQQRGTYMADSYGHERKHSDRHCQPFL